MKENSAFVRPNQRHQKADHFRGGKRTDDLAAGFLRDDEHCRGHDDGFPPGDALEINAALEVLERGAVADVEVSGSHFAMGDNHLL
jgi:hypothetical protein